VLIENCPAALLNEYLKTATPFERPNKAQSATLLVRRSCKQQLCFKRKSCGFAGSFSQSEQQELSLSTLTT